MLNGQLRRRSDSAVTSTRLFQSISTKICLDNLALIYANLSNQTNLSELAIIYVD